MKALVIYDSNNLLKVNFNKYDHVISYNYILKNINISSNKKIALPLDFITGRDYRMCDHMASIMTDKLQKKFFNKKQYLFFSKIFNQHYTNNIFKQHICFELSKIYLISFLIRKFRKNSKLKIKEFEVYSSNIDLKIYKNIFLKYSKFPKFRLHNIFYFKSFILKNLKNIFATINLLILPELIFIKNIIYQILSKKNKNKLYKNCFIISENQVLNEELISPLQFIKNIDQKYENTIFLNQSKKDLIWANENYKQKFINLNWSINKLYLNLNECLQLYFFLFNCRVKFIYNFFNLYSFSFLIYKNINQKIKWTLILSNFKFNNIFRSMHPGKVIDNLYFSEYGIKSYFIYYSNHGQIISRKIKKNISEYFQYSYLTFHCLIASKYSIDWFTNCQQNFFIKNINFGIYNSNFIKKLSKGNSQIKDKFSLNKSKKTIAFFDNSVGDKSMISLKSYNLFLKSIIILNKLEKYNIIFKSKKNLKYIYNLGDIDIIHSLNIIKKNKNIIYANELNLFSENVISLSDLSISLPCSSINYESFAANIKTLILDFDNYYNESHINFNIAKIPKLNNIEDVVKKVESLLAMKDNDFIEHKELYFNKIFDIQNSINLTNIETKLK